MGRTALRLLAATLAVAVVGGVAAAVAMTGRSSIGHPASRAWVHVWHAKRLPGQHRHHPPGSGATGTANTGGSLTPMAASSTSYGPAGTRPRGVTAPSAAESAVWRIAPVATGDVWATTDDAGVLVLAHWNGTAWRTKVVPVSLGLPTVDTLALSRPDGGVWLVGRAGPGVRIIRWNGRGFAAMKAPDVPLGDCVTTGVSGLATTGAETWLGGTAAPYGSCRHTVAFVERWDDRAWSRSALPAGPDSRLAGLATTGDGRLWAYGTTGRARALLLTYAGGVWRPVRVATLTAPIIAAAPDGGGGLWFATATTYAHLDAAGWHGFALPPSHADAAITSLVWAPGTRTVWLYGGQLTPSTSAKGGLATSTVLARLTA